ncbi:hypothetical protein SKAU_G00201260 [Synaphobranchus kaupii]|uniref:LRRCT domain-containing protein n=1 Tax=Synaphobranchus kaupii TaxID=118154 RepID=A0A9Q1FFU6_SYNKA|nr:hypothetical protein SKAU_G00201260 [Synaphobranchus kaupii]
MPQNLSSGVRELVVMTTGIMNVDPSAFPEGSKLSKLVFLNNLLQVIPRMAFNKLMALQELEISGNHRLEELRMGTLSELGNLTTLVLNFNRFRVLWGGLFDTLQKLETLQLKGNVIDELSDDLFHRLTRLHLLDLSLNMISTVKKEFFRKLSHLQILRLGYNLMDALPPDAFDTVPRLRELSLQGNKLVKVPRALFSRLALLEKLNLRGNLIKELAADAFPAKAKGAEHGLFQNLTALEHLDLSDNAITGLPRDTFIGLSELMVVHLEKNNISSLESGLFEDQDYLEQLYLSDNALQSVPVGFFDSFIAYNMIRLHGNPWTCDCHLLYLHDWLAFGSGASHDMSNVYCGAPSFLSGRGLVSLKREQLVCTASGSSHLQSTRAAEPPASRPGETLPTSGCVVQETNSTISVKCAMQKCPQFKLLTWYHKEGNTLNFLTEQRYLQGTQCLNSTITIAF